MPKVYIIILNYCKWQDTIACIESLLRLSYINYSIILIDNCSPNDSIENIMKWAEGNIKAKVDKLELSYLIQPVSKKPLNYTFFEEEDFKQIDDQSYSAVPLTIIKAKSNRGYSSGNNIGIRYALTRKDCDYFWLLNNDTLATTDSLSELIQYYRQRNDLFKIGIVGGKLLYYDSPNIIQCLGGATYNAYLGLIKQVGNCLPDNLDSSKEKKHLDYISGACMLVSIEFVKDVGFLSEDYFFYYEELDWCTRGHEKGWNIGYTERSIIYHKEGSTIKTSNQKVGKNEMTDYYYVRNKLLYSAKYKGIVENITIRLSLVGTIVNRILRGQFKRVSMIIRLIFHKY